MTISRNGGTCYHQVRLSLFHNLRKLSSQVPVVCEGKRGANATNKKPAAGITRGGLCKIDHRDEKFSSLADLAATYSSKP